MDALTQFVKLRENRSAHQAVVRLATAIAKGAEFPLLVLHGPPGSGKSHLVAGLLDRVVENSPSMTAQIVASVDLARSLMLPPSERIDVMREAVDTDLLVVEDVQHFLRAAAADLAHIIDRRQKRRRPVVFTSTVAPANLDLPARLLSRLIGGLVAGIAPLSPKSRESMATTFCSDRGIRVTPDVLSWLAQDPGGARPMLGEISRLETLSKSRGGRLDLAAVKAHLGDKAVMSTTLEQIVDQVAKRHRVSLRSLRGTSRTKNVVWPRQIAMYAARRAGSTLKVIGKYFGGRDHTTVMHSCEKVASLIKKDSRLAAELRELLALH